MIILDSNVLSEILRPNPETSVVTWMTRQAPSQLFTTAVTEAELRYGVARLDPGKRRDALMTAITGMFAVEFAGRVLPFDRDAAIIYGQLVSDRERHGRPFSQLDAQIAAIARSRDSDIATRNIRDFEGCGANLINPWA